MLRGPARLMGLDVPLGALFELSNASTQFRVTFDAPGCYGYKNVAVPSIQQRHLGPSRGIRNGG